VNSLLVAGPTDGETLGVAVSGSDLFVTNDGDGAGSQPAGTIGEYTTSGATVNASLVGGLFDPSGIAVAEVPEPSVIALLALGSGLLLVRPRCTPVRLKNCI
jgi:hypothetical protein